MATLRSHIFAHYAKSLNYILVYCCHTYPQLIGYFLILLPTHIALLQNHTVVGSQQLHGLAYQTQAFVRLASIEFYILLAHGRGKLYIAVLIVELAQMIDTPATHYGE